MKSFLDGGHLVARRGLERLEAGHHLGAGGTVRGGGAREATVRGAHGSLHGEGAVPIVVASAPDAPELGTDDSGEQRDVVDADEETLSQVRMGRVVLDDDEDEDADDHELHVVEEADGDVASLVELVVDVASHVGHDVADDDEEEMDEHDDGDVHAHVVALALADRAGGPAERVVRDFAHVLEGAGDGPEGEHDVVDGEEHEDRLDHVQRLDPHGLELLGCLHDRVDAEHLGDEGRVRQDEAGRVDPPEAVAHR
mmetsp:Transcript_86918/g.246285  ORF Transcript_86918/g.246285 Transcript_86918/m.246285 type:complete len:254 (-) Transcript_86918:407-1168(-)